MDRRRPARRQRAHGGRPRDRLSEERHRPALPQPQAATRRLRTDARWRRADVDVDHLLDRCTFPPAGTAVRCAFSGGADSTALVLLAVAAGCRVDAVHVDHGLRPSSGDEAAPAADLAARDRGAVPLPPRRRRAGTEPRSASTRRSASGARAGAATGHTADDQAETCSSTCCVAPAPAGSPAMRPGTRHPILALRRAETRRPVLASGLTPSSTRPTPTPGSCAIACAASCSRSSTRSPAVTSPPCSRAAPPCSPTTTCSSPIRPPSSTRPTPAPWPPRRRPLARRVRAQAGCRSRRSPARRSPRSTGCSPWPRGERVRCEIDGGRRVERHRQRLRILQGPESTGQSADRAVVSYDEMGNSDHAGGTR